MGDQARADTPVQVASELNDRLGAYTEPQILDMYHNWSVNLGGKISGIRFGQWCCNNYPDLREDINLWDEPDAKKVLMHMLQVVRGISA